ALLFTLLYQIQRRQGNVDKPAFNQLTHVPEEERKDKRPDVAAVNVRIGHDDDLVISQLVQVQRLRIVGGTKAHPKGSDDIFDLVVVVDLVFLCLLNVQDFPAKRK